MPQVGAAGRAQNLNAVTVGVGRVPHRGETVEAGGIRVTVETMHRNRVLQVLVRLPAAPDARAAGGNGSGPRDANVRTETEA